jgi:hypothetical protein
MVRMAVKLCEYLSTYVFKIDGWFGRRNLDRCGLETG